MCTVYWNVLCVRAHICTPLLKNEVVLFFFRFFFLTNFWTVWVDLDTSCLQEDEKKLLIVFYWPTSDDVLVFAFWALSKPCDFFVSLSRWGLQSLLLPTEERQHWSLSGDWFQPLRRKQWRPGVQRHKAGEDQWRLAVQPGGFRLQLYAACSGWWPMWRHVQDRCVLASVWHDQLLVRLCVLLCVWLLVCCSTDPTVNLVSVTVLGLRLILLKTIIFNVFLTFRLWLSHCKCPQTHKHTQAQQSHKTLCVWKPPTVWLLLLLLCVADAVVVVVSRRNSATGFADVIRRLPGVASWPHRHSAVDYLLHMLWCHF